jgi:hypothetical protein
MKSYSPLKKMYQTHTRTWSSEQDWPQDPDGQSIGNDPRERWKGTNYHNRPSKARRCYIRKSESCSLQQPHRLLVVVRLLHHVSIIVWKLEETSTVSAVRPQGIWQAYSSIFEYISTKNAHPPSRCPHFFGYFSRASRSCLAAVDTAPLVVYATPVRIAASTRPGSVFRAPLQMTLPRLWTRRTTLEGGELNLPLLISSTRALTMEDCMEAWAT